MIPFPDPQNPALPLGFAVNGAPINLADWGITDLRLTVRYAGPARLAWQMHRPQQELPIVHGAMVALWDPAYDATIPLFEGHVQEIAPTDSQTLDYVAFDPTRKAGQEITILDGPHDDPSSVPRAVFNPKIDSDDDYAFAVDIDATSGAIVATLLDNALPELIARGAAPAAGPAYVAGDLAPLDHRPQNKVVLESETLGGGIDQLLAAYPKYRTLFAPGPLARLWRFIDVTQSPEVTLVLNRFAPGDRHVLSLRLERSLERRATAVRIVGPRTLGQAIASVGDGGLTPLWTGAESANFVVFGPGGPGVGLTARAWQVSDPTRRHLGRKLPAEVQVPTNLVMLAGQSLTFLRTRRPTLTVSFDNGATYNPVYEVVLDTNRGIIYTPWPLYRRNDQTGAYLLPTDVRFYFSYHTEPLAVRFPPTGYSGTAYSAVGLARELVLYDESLAVGYENFSAISTPERLAEFAKLAENIHATTKDVVYTGGAVIRGLDYEFLGLDRRVNLAAVDADGNPLVTGWEAIATPVSEVEFDFASSTTTLVFAGDHLDHFDLSLAALKKLLHADVERAIPKGVVFSIDAPGLFQMTSTPVSEWSGPGFGWTTP